MHGTLLERAIAICSQKNTFYRNSPTRFLLILEQKGVICAYDLLAHNFIHRIESLNAYLKCEHFGCEHPMQLLTCEKCKQVIELSDPVIDNAFSDQARQSGFKITNKVLEAHGICHNCLYN